jgi:hypothetical protein
MENMRLEAIAMLLAPNTLDADTQQPTGEAEEAMVHTAALDPGY